MLAPKRVRSTDVLRDNVESLHLLAVDGVDDPGRSVGKQGDSFARRRSLLANEGVIGECGAQALHQVVLNPSVCGGGAEVTGHKVLFCASYTCKLVT